MKQFYEFFTVAFMILMTLINVSIAQKQKIILGTDIGGDIDDAFAVALVLSSPEFEVLGITMDYGNTPKRASIVCRMLFETDNDDIPVVVGEKTNDYYTPQFHWAEGFNKITPIEQSATAFIIEKLRQYPNEVILFTIGPVTNIGNIVEKDPEALKKAKKIYSMFGSFYMGYGKDPVPSAEANVRADVDASKLFVSSGADIVYAGLDITTFVNLGVYLWPELFEIRKAHIEVIENGYTVINEDKKPNAEIGMSINKEEFLNRFMKRLIQQTDSINF